MTKAEQKDKEVIKKLEASGEVILKQIEKKMMPSIELPVRSLNNIYFDTKSKTIKLGDKTSQRQFLNVAHTRKFMQTVLVASEIKKVIEQKATVSIRDLYYALKHTIEGTNENTFEDQSESVSPDEPLLVRMNDEFKITTGEEVVAFAKQNGKCILNEKEKTIYKVPNLSVCAFDENLKIKENPVKSLIIHPPNTVRKIRTSSGRSVKVTNSHSLFTLKDGQVTDIEAKNLSIGNFLALPRKLEITVNNESINVLAAIIQRCPSKNIEQFYVKSSRAIIAQVLERIGKEKIRAFVERKGYKNPWSAVKANWLHWQTIPIELIKETNPELSDIIQDLKISMKTGKHAYRTVIKKDKNLGFALGFLLSEGLLSKREVSVSNKNKSLLREFAEAFEKTFGEPCASKELLDNKDGTFKINAGYQNLAAILEFGLQVKLEKAWEKEIPALLLDAPTDCVDSFLRAFRKGDGSIGKRFEIRFHTTSQKLANGLIFLLLRKGIFSNMYEYNRAPHHTAFEVRVGNRPYSEPLSKITGDFTEKIFTKTSSLESDRIPNIASLLKTARKQTVLTEKIHKKINFSGIEKKNASISRNVLQKMVSELAMRTQSSEIDQLRRIANADLYWDKVVAIEEAPLPPYTIDFSVEPCQNFVGGNGFLVLHNSDPIIEDIEASLNLLREELHLAASSKGVIVGDMKIKDGKDTIDLTKMGSGGWGVPSNVEPERIELKDVAAEYILFIEKDAVWKRFNEDQFWQKNKCILITGRGQPSRAERRLVQRLNQEYDLPVYALMDADPWGMYIYSVIKQGSISLSYSEEKLATPDTKYLGLTISDVDTYKIPKDVTIKLNQLDVKRLNEMAGYDWFKKKEWQEEFQRMKDRQIKLELEALSKKGIRFISQEYLPDKIKRKDFLP